MAKECCDVRYRCIFTDINMPEMDGITEAKHIINHEKILLLQNPGHSKIEIVMVTAFDTEEVIEKVKQLGITQFLVKPVNIKLVTPILERTFTGFSHRELPQSVSFRCDNNGSVNI